MSRARARWAAAALGAAVYLPGLGAPLQFDDVHTLWFPGVAGAGAGWVDMLLSPGYYTIVGFGSYHPLPTLLQGLLHQILPAPEFWLRLLSAATHAACSALVAEAAFGLLPSAPAAAAAGLLFAAHPVHAQAVLGVGWYAEPLAAFFSLSALVGFFRSSKDARWAWASAASFLAAIFCKEHALILPLLMALAPGPAAEGEASPGLGARWRGLADGAKRALLGGWAAAYALYAWVVVFKLKLFQASSSVAAAGPVMPGEGPQARLVFALRLLFLPRALGPFHSAPGFAELAADAAAAAILLALAFWLLQKARRLPLGAFALLWTVLSLWAVLLPVGLSASQNKFARNFFSERYLYMASAGWAWLAAWAAWAAVRQIDLRPRWAALRRAPAFLIGGAVLAGSAAVLWQDLLWADSTTLLEQAVDAAPASPEAQLRMGEQYLDLDSPQKAEAHFRALLALPGLADVDRSRALRGLASCRALRRDYPGARSLALEAVRGNPRDSAAWSLLGGLDLLRGDDEAGVEALKRSIDLRPVQTAAYYQLALHDEKRGKLEDAAALLELLARLDPGYADVRGRLARLRGRTSGKMAARIERP